MSAGCLHNDFDARVEVTRIVGGQYFADVRVKCVQCGIPFQFLGLPVGVQMVGAASSFDRQEARLAIRPAQQVLGDP